jgi:hypothetical protein
MARYRWLGPATVIELWGDGREEPAVSETVAPGREIAAELDPSHPLVAGWMSFGLMEEIEPAPAERMPRKADRAVTKETSDG